MIRRNKTEKFDDNDYGFCNHDDSLELVTPCVTNLNKLSEHHGLKGNEHY